MKVALGTSRSARWRASELPSSGDLNDYPATDAPPRPPTTPHARYTLNCEEPNINYALATEDRQRDLLENYAKLFNSFSAGEQVQVTVLNRRITRDTLLAKVLFPEPRYGDAMTTYRQDYNGIIKSKIGPREYSIVAEKYLTLTITASTLEHAESTVGGWGSSVQRFLMWVVW